MESLKKLYKIGFGPSSSHTMGPERAANIFLNKNKDATNFKVELFGSLAETGKGHLTDKMIYKVLGEKRTTVIFKPEITYSYHPNGMMFKAYKDNVKIDEWLVFSVGGGTLKELNEERDSFKEEIYPEKNYQEVAEYCKKNNMSIIDYTLKHEPDIKEYLKNVLVCMKQAVSRGICTSGILPGGLNVERKAAYFYQKYLKNHLKETLCYAAALAVSEENANGSVIVTAPTCGSAGVVPGILYTEYLYNKRTDEELINSLMVGGLIGNLVKTNGSISGAEVGCQGEVGVACAMASAMIAYLEKGTIDEIEYAAEIALEHHLGMTCDPVDGLVQIPCIERNAIAAMQAYNCASYSLLSDGIHNITFDNVVEVMEQTGHDLQKEYRETSKGGLALRCGIKK